MTLIIFFSFAMSKKQKTTSVHVRCSEYKDIFRVDDSILFCNYCNVSIDWKRKSTVDNHCKSQKHLSNVKSQEKTQNNTQTCHKKIKYVIF